MGIFYDDQEHFSSPLSGFFQNLISGALAVEISPHLTRWAVRVMGSLFPA